MRRFKIVIKDGFVAETDGNEQKVQEFEEDSSLKLYNFIMNYASPECITHKLLDAIQNYCNVVGEHCMWNFEDYLSAMASDLGAPEDDYLLFEIDIDGEVRYYEEW